MFVAKTTERFVDRQLQRFLDVIGIYADHQSAYRPCHIAEKALLCIHNDIAQSVDARRSVLLVLLNIFAALDIIYNLRCTTAAAARLWHQWRSIRVADVLPPTPNICGACQERTIAA